MLVVIVEVQVKLEAVEAFRRATFENARMSLTEPGVARFDVLEQQGEPNRFVLVEVYRDDAAPAAHKQTAHYAAWRDAVEPMMAAARKSTKFHGVFPGAAGWDAATKG
jgi:autoinducer 2-degrading protein